MADSIKEIEKLRKDLAEFLCEDASTFKLEECFKIFHTFGAKFTQAQKENEERKLQEEKAEARKKMREQQVEAARRRHQLQGEREEWIYNAKGFLKKVCSEGRGGGWMLRGVNTKSHHE